MNNEKFAFKEENRDLERYQLFQTVKTIVLTILWFAIGIAALIHYSGGDIIALLSANVLRSVVFVAAYIALCLAIVKPQDLILNGDWSGTVGRKYHAVKYSSRVGSNGRTMTRGITKLQMLEVEMIRTYDNKTKKMEFYGDSYALATDYYKTGDRIYHFRGFKYPYKERKPDEKYKVCIACGYLADSGDDVCPCCKHSLIK